MFTVKLGTGKTFEATAVDERYQPATEFAAEAYSLNFEASPAERDLAEYVEMCSEEGALATVEVSVGGETAATYTGYEGVADATARLLPTGAKSVSVRLLKAAGREA